MSGRACLAAQVGWGGVLLVLLAVLVGAGCGRGFDPYDEDVRGAHSNATARVSFGQRIGPDGDGCWPDGGKVFCDLTSIGGLHWDAGDVRVEKSSDIYMDSGFLCLRDRDYRPWCWEWSSDVPPRPARVPQGELFAYITGPAFRTETPGPAGFVCGLALGLRRVSCWTVGVDQPDYRQANHRFVEGGEWIVRSVGHDPPHFEAANRGPLRDARFHAFNGAELSPFPREPRVLVTERLR